MKTFRISNDPSGYAVDQLIKINSFLDHLMFMTFKKQVWFRLAVFRKRKHAERYIKKPGRL